MIKKPSNEDSTMEELCQRFPSIAQKTMNNVDNKTLIDFKEASKITYDFLEKERFYWIRIIQKYKCLIGELKDVWVKVVKKTPAEIIKELAVAVHQFPQTMFRAVALDKFPQTMFKFRGKFPRKISGKLICYLSYVQSIEKYWHPLFIGAACGSVNLCNHIIQKTCVTDPMLSWGKITPLVFAAKIMEDVNVFKFLLNKAEDKNPILIKRRKWSLFHDLAEKGCLEMCRLMVKKVEDKNPFDWMGQTPYHIIASTGDVKFCRKLMKDLKDKHPKDHVGQTPLHRAASNGHVKLCRRLMRDLKDKNPEDHSGKTPLHQAACNGHVEMCQILMKSVNNKNPKDLKGQTPLHWAAWNGHVEVCQILMENLKNKNPKDHRGQTPLHCAAWAGHVEVCQILRDYLIDKNPEDNNGQTPYLRYIPN